MEVAQPWQGRKWPLAGLGWPHHWPLQVPFSCSLGHRVILLCAHGWCGSLSCLHTASRPMAPGCQPSRQQSRPCLRPSRIRPRGSRSGSGIFPMSNRWSLRLDLFQDCGRYLCSRRGGGGGERSCLFSTNWHDSHQNILGRVA